MEKFQKENTKTFLYNIYHVLAHNFDFSIVIIIYHGNIVFIEHSFHLIFFLNWFKWASIDSQPVCIVLSPSLN